MVEEFKPEDTSTKELSLDRANNYLYQLVYGDLPVLSHPSSIVIASQEEGLGLLNGFLQDGADFETLKIFQLDFSDTRYRRQKGQRQFYLGKLKDPPHHGYYLAITAVCHLGHEPEFLYVVPRRATVGRSPYYWIEFYEDIQDMVRPALLGYRLWPDRPTTKIDSKYWNGLEEQLLVDNILGENEIETADLVRFKIKLNPKGHPYTLGGVQSLKFNLTGNSRIIGNDELLVVPEEDDQQIYSWITINKEEAEKKKEARVATYMVLREEKRIKSIGWRGPETQYLIDYLDDDPKIAFSNLRPVRVRLYENINQVGFGKGKKAYYHISIGNSKEIGVDEVMLVPKEDPKNLYQWVEVYKFQPETGEIVGEAIASIRMIRGVGFERMGWLGPGIQSLKDYTDGVKNFDDLLPITLRVGENTKMVDVWSEVKQKRTHVFLTTSVKSNLTTGSIFQLIPEKEEGGLVTYRMKTGETDLGFYSYDKQTNRFTALEIYDVREPQPRYLLLSYSNGEAVFADLKPIELTMKGNSMLGIVTKGTSKIFITPAKAFNIKKDDKVTLTPIEEVDGNVIFAFAKGSEILGYYRFDIAKKRFYLRGIKSADKPKDTTEADNYLRGLVFGEEQI